MSLKIRSIKKINDSNIESEEVIEDEPMSSSEWVKLLLSALILIAILIKWIIEYKWLEIAVIFGLSIVAIISIVLSMYYNDKKKERKETSNEQSFVESENKEFKPSKLISFNKMNRKVIYGLRLFALFIAMFLFFIIKLHVDLVSLIKEDMRPLLFMGIMFLVFSLIDFINSAEGLVSPIRAYWEEFGLSIGMIIIFIVLLFFNDGDPLPLILLMEWLFFYGLTIIPRFICREFYDKTSKKRLQLYIAKLKT